MADPSALGLPASYIFTILAVDGRDAKLIPRPFLPTDDARIRILLTPIHPNPSLAGPEEFDVTMPIVRAMQMAGAMISEDVIVAPISGGPGLSAGEVQVARELVERIRREQHSLLKRTKVTFSCPECKRAILALLPLPRHYSEPDPEFSIQCWKMKAGGCGWSGKLRASQGFHHPLCASNGSSNKSERRAQTENGRARRRDSG